MSAVTLIFPHQLFEKSIALSKERPVILVEEFLFFKQYTFHKQKICFHRATMRCYEAYLRSEGFEVLEYIGSQNEASDARNLLPYLAQKGVKEIYFCDPIDNWLSKRISKGAIATNIETFVFDTPMFLNTSEEIKTYFSTKKRYFQTDFYVAQRKQRSILVDEKNNPVGGKWTFDTENRLKYPKNKIAPKVIFPTKNEYWNEAEQYVETFFPKNYGILSKTFIYPTTFEESKKWLQDFFKTRFEEFGEYEDAIVSKEITLHHSILTPMMNVGLLTPAFILEEALLFAEKNQTPINSLEGFIRQILGWREFIRAIYELEGTKERTTNHWKFDRKIPESFWTGTTGIEPIDSTIKKILETGYCHHIERLMVLGNFMLLCEFDPNEVYRWFMELFIDSYDWVMVTNVYGMSQFADGGLMATKPYISGSNYLMKMSDFPKGDWQPIWDGMFWSFMDRQRAFFLKNPRLGMLVSMFDKMPIEKKEAHFRNAEKMFSRLV